MFRVHKYRLLEYVLLYITTVVKRIVGYLSAPTSRVEYVYNLYSALTSPLILRKR